MTYESMISSLAYHSSQLQKGSFLLLALLGSGRELVAAQITFGPSKTDKVAIVETYYFRVRAYTPPIPVSPSPDLQTLSPNTPERAALAHYTSMLQGDYERWLGNWDEASRQEIIQRNTERGRDAEFWKGIWQKSLAPYTVFELVRRVDSDAFVIIEFRGSGAHDEREDLVLDVILKEDTNGKWRPTNGFARDPVVLYWRNPETPIETIAREPPKQ